MKSLIEIILLLFISVAGFAAPPNINWWLTKGDQSVLFQLQRDHPLTFGNTDNQLPVVLVDSTKRYQEIDGFGYALTGSSAFLISKMNATARKSLLENLFGNESWSIGVSYIRISVGASDLSPSVFSYDDNPGDESLDKFNLGPDKTCLVPLLQEILKINPKLKILASPWSAPTWMKDNNSAIGGTLKPRYYQAYANYLVKYLQAMKSAGIKIESLTPQNEPMALQNNPSMGLTSQQELSFVKDYLGPAIRKAGLAAKIIIWDHNCDNPQYPLTILADAGAREYIDGSAFHLYSGDISALSTVHKAYPEKNVYFTEQYTASTGGFGGDLKWHVKNLIVGATRNWSRNVIEWNLANDDQYGPHTPGGCSTCKGAVTINYTNAVQRNVSYYIIAHASKFVPPGSVRIWSSMTGSLNTVAFLTPEGKKVLIVENDGNGSQSFNIKCNGLTATASLDGGSVATYVW